MGMKLVNERQATIDYYARLREYAIAHGYYVYWGFPETGAAIEFPAMGGCWLPCAKDHPGARPSLNRAAEEMP